MKIILCILLVCNFLYAKKDFYYSFINSSGSQISQQRKADINDGFEIIEQVRELAKLGKIDDAYAQIKTFKEQNKLKVLKSDILITYSEMALKKGSKRFILSAARELEQAVNSSIIHEEDLPQAYMLLVELKLKSNKLKDARYFAQTIIKNFSNEITNAYGKIYLAKVYRHTKEYKKATRTLYDILINTTDVLVATIVADELFDIYILDDQREKAYELISKVLTKNIDYYANDSFIALEKVNKLIKAGMPEFAVEILNELLSRTNKEGSVEDFKFKLANVYMMMYDGTNYYLFKAKELYKDILNDFPDGLHAKKSKMYIDEILMREGALKTNLVALKYKNSEAMQQKVLLQELLNDKKAKKYAYILKSRKVYRKVSNSITKRFAFESIDSIFDDINILMIKDYLMTEKCFLMNKALKTSRRETLELLIKDEDVKFKFFECLIEVPYERGYMLVKEAFNSSRDATLYLYLERMAYALGLYDEALAYSAKVEMIEDKEVLSKEFLQRFLILSSKKDTISMEKFFSYALRHQEYIDENKDNPLIVDFYYQFYLYLTNRNQLELANTMLMNLYNKQKEIKAPIYSPFVELELAQLQKDKTNYQGALDYVNESLSFSRNIKPNDLAKVYYELIRLYENLGNKEKQEEFVLKCKEVQGTTESLYKNMCDKM